MDVLQQGHEADPHRRLLRHTYQEGPGFLFLATRGGRPPQPAERRGFDHIPALGHLEGLLTELMTA
jgi:hypothetical protein